MEEWKYAGFPSPEARGQHNAALRKNNAKILREMPPLPRPRQWAKRKDRHQLKMQI